MEIVLSPDMQTFVENQLGSGRFESASQVVSESLRLMREREKALARLRKEVDIGIGQADRGECIDGEKAFAKLLERLGNLPPESDEESLPLNAAS